MASLLDTRLGIVMAGAVAVAIGAGAVVWLQGAGARQAAPAAEARAASAWDGPIGPGALPRATPMDSPAPATPEEKPLTDGDGHLLVDARLHGLFDTYLLQATGAGARDARARELRAWLGRRLGQPALGEADALLKAYVGYLQAEDELRARVRFTRPDPAGLTGAQVDQMVAWQQMRAQMRERMLGVTVAQAWFGPEDAECNAAFADWRKQSAPIDSEEVDSNELRARRLHGAALAERRNEQAQSCAARLMGTLAQNR